MRYYNWTNITICIDGWCPSLEKESFRHFLTSKIEGIRIDVTIIYTDQLPEVSGELIHSTYEYEIIKDENREHRFFINPWIEKKFALLHEESDYVKKLYILKEYAYRIGSDVELFNYLAMERTMYKAGIWILHSSFIQTEKGAVLFSAPSGTGKSTQAALWNEYKGAKIINGDRSAIWRDENNVWYAGGVPWWGTSEITHRINMPLASIVLLSKAEKNSIVELDSITKIKKLIRENSINPWNRKMIANAQLTIIDLCNSIPVIALACRPDEEAVNILAEKLGIE